MGGLCAVCQQGLFLSDGACLEVCEYGHFVCGDACCDCAGCGSKESCRATCDQYAPLIYQKILSNGKVNFVFSQRIRSFSLSIFFSANGTSLIFGDGFTADELTQQVKIQSNTC